MTESWYVYFCNCLRTAACSCLQGQSGADLHDSIKRYRQSIFKLTYKLKKTKQNHKARHKILVLQNAAERVLADQKQQV